MRRSLVLQSNSLFFADTGELQGSPQGLAQNRCGRPDWEPRCRSRVLLPIATLIPCYILAHRPLVDRFQTLVSVGRLRLISASPPRKTPSSAPSTSISITSTSSDDMSASSLLSGTFIISTPSIWKASRENYILCAYKK